MVKRDVDVLALNLVRAGELAGFREAGVFDLFRRMATAAGVGAELGIQLRRYAGLGMAGGALRMTWERRKDALRVELVAESTIGSEAGFGVDTRFGVDVFRVSELKQDGAAAL
jgi:predicted RecA/RadA family phage recombinase